MVTTHIRLSILCILASQFGFATSYNWTDGAGGNEWTTTGNWDTPGYPSMSTDTATIDINTPCNLSSGSLNVGQVIVGNTTATDASFTIQDGASLTSNAEAYFGYSSGTTGNGTVTGAGSEWLLETNSLFIGNNGIGNFTISSEGGVVSIAVGLGISGGTGTLNISSGGQLLTALLATTTTGSASFDGGILQLFPMGIPSITGFTPGNFVLEPGGLTIGTNSMTVTTDTTVMSGPGQLTVSGMGMLTLNGVNTYTGGTVVSPGILQAGVSYAIPPVGTVQIESMATFDLNGTIQIIGGLSGDGSVTLGGGVLIIGSNGANTTFDGVISDMALGEVTIQEGQCTLTNMQTYSGPTFINTGGTLIVDGSIASSSLITIDPTGTLGGYGYVGNVANYGTIAPGNSIGSITVEGTYTQYATGGYQDEINAAGGTDQIIVTGVANLAGELNIIPAPGTYIKGTTYTILTAGEVIGKFEPIVVTNPAGYLLNFGIDYLSDSVVLTYLNAGLIFTASVNHYNPQQVLSYLLAADLDSDPDLLSVGTVLTTLSDPTAALDQLHPAIFGAFELLNANTSSLGSKIFNHRLSTNCPMNINPCCECNQLNAWLEPFGYCIEQDRVGEQVGFRADAIGILGGLDYTFQNGFLLGIGGGYDKEHIKWKHHRGRGNINSGHLGIYGNWIQAHYYVEAAAVGGINAYDASRFINFPTVDRTAKHDSKGYDFTGHLAGGYAFEHCDYEFGPFASVDYLYLRQNGFKEKGALSLDLDVHAKNSNMLRSEAGLSLSHSGAFGCPLFIPTIWVSCVNESYLNISHYKSSFVGQEGDFKVRSWNKSITMVSPGAELDLLLENNLSLGARYSAELNGQVATQKGDVHLEYSF